MPEFDQSKSIDSSGYLHTLSLKEHQDLYEHILLTILLKALSDQYFILSPCDSTTCIFLDDLLHNTSYLNTLKERVQNDSNLKRALCKKIKAFYAKRYCYAATRLLQELKINTHACEPVSVQLFDTDSSPFKDFSKGEKSPHNIGDLAFKRRSLSPLHHTDSLAKTLRIGTYCKGNNSKQQTCPITEDYFDYCD